MVVCLSASCVSINDDNSLPPYKGKLLLDYNNIEQSSFNIDISFSNKGSIIQIKKPFYGNILKIKVSEGKNLVFLPTKNTQPFVVPRDVDRNFKYWLRQCLLSKKLNISNTYDEINFEFKCLKNKNRTNFYIKYDNFLIEGFVSKK